MPQSTLQPAAFFRATLPLDLTQLPLLDSCAAPPGIRTIVDLPAIIAQFGGTQPGGAQLGHGLTGAR